MEIAGIGKRVRIYLGEHDKSAGAHGPLWETILDLLRTEGAAGATMFRGLAGFGAHSQLHIARLADILSDLPIVVEWIDGPDRVERLLPRVCALVTTGMITVEDVEIVKYTHRQPRPLPPDTVGDVMSRDVVAVRPETPVSEAVRMLLNRDYRALPVVDDQGRLVGIVTNRDLVERGGLSARVELLAALGSPALERELASSGAREKNVAEVMTREVVSARPSDRLDQAARLMVERRVKRLPVTDDQGRLVGILSRVDVLRTMGEDYLAPPGGPPAAPDVARTVGELMRRDVPAVLADAPLGEVLDAVTSTRLNRAIVVDTARRVLGVVSDADLLARLDPGAETGLLAALMRRGKLSRETPGRARDVVRAPALTVPADTPIAEAVRMMLEERRKVLPITDAEGRLLGAVDRANLLAHLRWASAEGA